MVFQLGLFSCVSIHKANAGDGGGKGYLIAAAVHLEIIIISRAEQSTSSSMLI